MLTYARVERPEFTAIQDTDGVIYHQRGNYELGDDTRAIIPVNRSYRPLYGDSILAKNPDAPYVRDRLIHDTLPASAELRGHERKLMVFGKTLLFVDSTDSQAFIEHSSQPSPLAIHSDESRRVLDMLKKELTKQGASVQFGVHGSHEVGLNGADSDMDLIAWVPREERSNALDMISDLLINNGYTNANRTKKFNEFVVRIANLTELPLEVSAHLAKQRNRWISPSGVFTSLQCIHADYDHNQVNSLLEIGVNGLFEAREEVFNLPVEVVGRSEPFNYPRAWTISHNDKEYPLISFNMVHQGMGTDGKCADSYAGPQVLTASKVESVEGLEIFFMKDDSHYLLPATLVAN